MINLITQVKIGEVIKRYNELYVVVSIKNNEDTSSVCYDRKYILVKFDDINKYNNEKSVIELNQLRTVEVSVIGNNNIPEVERVEYIPPFEITLVSALKIRKMTPKTITIYE